MKNYSYFLLLVLLMSHCRPKEDSTVTEFEGKPEVPAAIKTEHLNLLDAIGRLTLLTDSTGRAAVKLNELMQHHFEEEESYVLPPLGSLPSLAGGQLPEQSKEVIGLSEKLKAQLNHMLAEHQLIKAFMHELIVAAARENHPEAIALEKVISKHAAMEEEVYFPAAIIVGEYLKLKAK